MAVMKNWIPVQTINIGDCFALDGAIYRVMDGDDSCRNCAFDSGSPRCAAAPICHRVTRLDGRSVYFEETMITE